MSVGTILVELAEKMGLLAAAAVVAVLLPPLRNRLLGVGRNRDRLAAAALGLALAIWGSLLGMEVMGEHMNVRAIGVLIAGILGGVPAGVVAGLGGGLFVAWRGDADTGPWMIAASIIDGVIAGWVAERRPAYFQGWRAFVTALSIQTVHLVLVGIGLLAVGHATRYLPAWPAHVVKLLVNAAGVTLFVVVAKLVVAREEGAVALVEAQAAADRSALQSLRRRLEPHFLFNALNALRATIRTDPARARELVNDMADLYRYLLSHPEDATVRDEVAHACAYLGIERVRLGPERLTVQTDIAESVTSARVPALLLQPLVENAVKHGIGARAGPGTVRIRARAQGKVLEIEVEDRCEGEPLAPEQGGSGIALRTLRQRLDRLYGSDASLELETRDRGARAIVRLPLSDTVEERPAG